MPELLFKEESFKIIGLCMEIHKTLMETHCFLNNSLSA